LLTLVLGGARSGKSGYAEQCARDSKKQVVYIATAAVKDEEMRCRVERHRDQRPNQWQTVEEPINLAAVIHEYSSTSHFLLIECLTLWLNNVLYNQRGEIQESVLERQSKQLIDTLVTFSGDLIIVSNELGLGVVAMDKNTRRFVDEAGLLHQKIAQISDRVVLVTAGIPQILK